MLPETTAWAGAHGVLGWMVWILWAAGGVVCVDLALVRRLWQPAVWGLYVVVTIAAWMVLTGPGTWPRAVLALLAIGYIALLLHLAARRVWPTTRTRRTR